MTLRLEVGDLLGPLGDEQDDEEDLRVVLLDGLGDRLEDGRLAGPRRRDDEAALALADGRQELHDPGVHVLGIAVLELDHLERVEGRQALEIDVPALLDDDIGVHEVDGLDLDQGEILLAVLGGPDDAGDRVAGPELELADLGRRNVDVVLAGQVAEFRGPQEAEAVLQALQDAFREEQALLLGLGLEDLEDEVVLARALDVVRRPGRPPRRSWPGPRGPCPRGR